VFPFTPTRLIHAFAVSQSLTAQIDFMKKFLTIIFSFLGFISLRAQEPADVLRYSWYVPGASARIKATGGAMGSLGGDITATFVNPAGLGFYKTGDLILSPAYSFGNTKGTYFNRTESQNSKRFTWGTTGFVTGGGPIGNMKSSSFSIAYNRTADFNSHILYRGLNNQSSYSQKYLEQISRNNINDGNVLANNFSNGASLAFNTLWIDTVGGGVNGNFQFQSRSKNILSAGGLLQQNDVETHGGIDEFALGMAVNMKDKLFFGGSLGVPILHFKRTTEFVEVDPTENKNKFNYAQVQETLRTAAVGINLKLGLIYKPSEYWRLGLAFHTPTYYNSVKDEYTTTITTDIDKKDSVLSDYSVDYNNGNADQFKYSLTTPYRVIGSISYVIREVQDVTRQRGFLTADVEYVNYKASSFSAYTDENTTTDESTKAYLKQLNKAIDNAYRGAFNFRLGGELKFTTVMLRLGAAYYSNPYKNINGEKGSKMDLSGGLGYRNKGVFVDLTYVHSLNKDVNFAYRLQSSPYSGASIKSGVNNIYLTVGFKI
jgi:hypothetical protein